MRKSLLWVAGVALVLVLALAAYTLSGENIDLIATERVDVYRAPRGAEKNSVVATLAKGEKSVVIGCDIEKDDVTPIVRLPDGRTGYVVGGRIRLERTRASLLELRRIVHGCG